MAHKKKNDPRIDADGWFTLNIDQMFEAYMKENQKTWGHDRSQSIGASEIFSCLRQLFCKKRGKEFGILPDDDYVERWGATERGNIIEQHFVAPALTTQCPDGVTLHYAGNDQITLIEKRNSATPDGLFDGLPRAPLRIIAGGALIELPDFDADCLGLEIKSIDPRAHLGEERVKHRFQSIVGMGMVREKTEYKPTHWLILYFDASWLDNVSPFIVEFDEAVYASAKRRAPLIWKFNDINQFEPEGKYNGECDHCMFRKACGEAILTEWATTSEDPADDPEIVDAMGEPVSAFLEAKADLEEAEERLNRCKQAVKDALLEVGVRKVRSDAWSVSWTTQKGRKTINYKKAVADNQIDLAPYTDTGPSIDTLRVLPKDKNEGTPHDQH